LNMTDYFNGFEAVIDLHGLRIEEGIEQLERFLDQALLHGESEVKVIHGHGSGRLKSAVRAYLKKSPYAAASHTGEPWEGGEAVTIVTLKRDR